MKQWVTHHRPAGERCGDGYTLMEVLAALAVVAVVLPMAMQAIALAGTVGSAAQRQREAATLAQMKLQELVSTGDWQMGAMSGDFAEIDAGSAGYRWQTQMSDWQGGMMRELQVEVSWVQRSERRTVMLTTLVDPGL